MDIIVTGATGGIGHCLVKCGIEDNNIENIYCLYRNQQKFDGYFKQQSLKLVLEKYDASFMRDNSSTIQELYKNRPQYLTCIFTMFSIYPIKKIGTYSSNELKNNININILDQVMFINWLIELKKCCNVQLKLINIDSGAAYKPLEGWSLYSASKAYINMFLKTIQIENSDIKIVTYEPGVVDTQMQEQIRNTDRKIFRQVEKFCEYYDKKLLHNPMEIAKDIWKRYVVDWEGINFREGYDIG